MNSLFFRALLLQIAASPQMLDKKLFNQRGERTVIGRSRFFGGSLHGRCNPNSYGRASIFWFSCHC
jgi:hypothetical protein